MWVRDEWRDAGESGHGKVGECRTKRAMERALTGGERWMSGPRVTRLETERDAQMSEWKGVIGFVYLVARGNRRAVLYGGVISCSEG